MSGNKTTPTPAKAQRDNEFYFQDIVFLVEDHLFKVPARNFITESEVFETMFKLPQNPDIAPDGLSDDQPLRLEGVKKDGFRQLLRVMYPSGTGKALTLTTEQWLSVLELSTRWDMTEIRAQAIKDVRAALHPDSDLPSKLLNHGQTYRVDEWVVESIQDFTRRRKPMDMDDVEAIGIENVLKIASLREFFLATFTPSSMGRVNKIRQVFGFAAE